MSRKYIDDNVELKLVNSVSSTLQNLAVGLPRVTNLNFDRGHLCVDPDSGLRFTNEGNTTINSLFVNPRYNVLELYENLLTLPHIAANQSASTNTAAIIAAGTNSVDGGATFATTGGVTLTTTTGSGDQEALAFTNTNSGWGTVSLIANNGLIFETQIVTGAAITSEVVWAGLKLTFTSVVATDDDQTFFRYAAATDGFWHIVTSVGGTDVDMATDVTVVVSTAYLFQIRVGTDRKPHYFINGKRVGIGAALTASTALKPFVGVQTATTAAKNITVRHLRVLLPRTPFAT